MTVAALRAAAARMRADVAEWNARRLAEDNVKLVWWAVGRVLGLKPRDERFDEAAGVGMVVLMKASRGFDPAFGVTFATYASKSLFRELLKWHREEQAHGFGGARAACRDGRLTLRKPLTLFERDGGHRDAPDRTEEGMGHVGAGIEAADAGPPGSPESAFGPDLAPLVRNLSAREREVLVRRLVNGETLDGVAADSDVSKERVRQVQAKAVSRLREVLTGRAGHDGSTVSGAHRSPRRRCKRCHAHIPNVGNRVRCRPGVGCRKDEPPRPLVTGKAGHKFNASEGAGGSSGG